MKKIFLFFALYTVSVIIILPAIITGSDSKMDEKGYIKPSTSKEITTIGVVNGEIEEFIRSSDMDEYIKGVVAVEMSPSFEEEALKAQAVAARTYALYTLRNATADIDYTDIGQAYASKNELKEKWGVNFNSYYKKISDAVNETSGEVLVYENEPILAVFHSSSAGATENSENVWQQSLPYLVSVDSSQDELSSNFIQEKIFDENELIWTLQNNIDNLTLTEADFISQCQIIEKSDAGYVESIQIGNKMLTGKTLREILGLRSAAFTIRQDGENVIFTTKGYGHGAGMSQYGANFMALSGAKYEEILIHYYTGVSIKNINDIN
ncbi:MAG: stage II sporulation protein D [Lachnospiraceae bacterium]|nr:stage II sporulation protein D [Lachnospiraceae bacterium]